MAAVKVLHEIKGRMRVAYPDVPYDAYLADALSDYLTRIEGVTHVKVYSLTGDVSISFSCDRREVLRALVSFDFAKVPEESEEETALAVLTRNRLLADEYREKIVLRTVLHFGFKYFAPLPVRIARTAYHSYFFIKEALTCLKEHKLEVSVLDATAIVVSMLRGDFDTASSVMFLLGIGDTLEEWTHKKSVDDLARSMSLKVDKVWVKAGETEVQIPLSDVKEGDVIVVRTGSVIPLDGTVKSGDAFVNQSSFTGESAPVHKTVRSYVYAGTVVEQGDLCITVKHAAGQTRFEQIVKMIEASEQFKSGLEARAEHLADHLVPYSFLGTALTYALTQNADKALSILMVDFSCALKLAMPLSVLSAMRESMNHHITVKGGRFLEAVAEADTLIFDKTGTLTKATPKVVQVIPFNGFARDEMLRIAACLEEHYPHSIANAVVEKALEEGLRHDEMHGEVEYVVAHGIASLIGTGRKKQRVVIGSYHFVFEDEGCTVPANDQKKFEDIPAEETALYLAIGGELAAVLLIEDPLREEAPDVIRALRAEGFTNIVMMTGDNYKTAERIAAHVGVDEFHAEVLPEDKASYVERMKEAGHKVLMVGDGINDSPALSAADCGIAIAEGAQLARQIADITVSEEGLMELVTLRRLSKALMRRIQGNYRFVMGFNSGLIALGVAGILPPATSALLHNTSTLAVGLHSMTDYLQD